MQVRAGRSIINAPGSGGASGGCHEAETRLARNGGRSVDWRRWRWRRSRRPVSPRTSGRCPAPPGATPSCRATGRARPTLRWSGPRALGDQAFLSEEELAAANEILTAEGSGSPARPQLPGRRDRGGAARADAADAGKHPLRQLDLAAREPAPAAHDAAHVADRGSAERQNPAADSVRAGARGAAAGREPLADHQHLAAVVRQPPDPDAAGALPRVAPRGPADAASLLQRPDADPADRGLRGHHAGDA